MRRTARPRASPSRTSRRGSACSGCRTASPGARGGGPTSRGSGSGSRCSTWRSGARADALWAMEQALGCADLAAVVGEVWGDPAALDFTATKRLALRAEASGRAGLADPAGGAGRPVGRARAVADRGAPLPAPPRRPPRAGRAAVAGDAVPRPLAPAGRLGGPLRAGPAPAAPRPRGRGAGGGAGPDPAARHEEPPPRAAARADRLARGARGGRPAAAPRQGRVDSLEDQGERGRAAPGEGRRILSLWLPGFALERRLALMGREAPPADQPFALAVEGTHGPVVHAVNAAAREAGARPGGRVVDARAVCPALRVDPADLARRRRRPVPPRALAAPLVPLDLRGRDRGGADGRDGLRPSLGRRGRAAGADRGAAGAAGPLGRRRHRAHHRRRLGARPLRRPPRALRGRRRWPATVGAAARPGAAPLGRCRAAPAGGWGSRRWATLAAVPRLPLARRFVRAAPRRQPPAPARPDDGPGARAARLPRRPAPLRRAGADRRGGDGPRPLGAGARPVAGRDAGGQGVRRPAAGAHRLSQRRDGLLGRGGGLAGLARPRPHGAALRGAARADRSGLRLRPRHARGRRWPRGSPSASPGSTAARRGARTSRGSWTGSPPASAPARSCAPPCARATCPSGARRWCPRSGAPPSRRSPPAPAPCACSSRPR